MKIFEIMMFLRQHFRHAGGGRCSMTLIPSALYIGLENLIDESCKTCKSRSQPHVCFSFDSQYYYNQELEYNHAHVEVMQPLYTMQCSIYSVSQIKLPSLFGDTLYMQQCTNCTMRLLCKSTLILIDSHSLLLLF